MRSRRLRIAVQLSVLGLVVWWLVVPKLRGSSHSLPLLWDLDTFWVPLALAAELASLVAYTLATRTMLSAAVRPSYPKVMCIDLSSIALGHCLPDGGAAGTALSWRLLVKNGVPSGDAAFAKFAQGLGSAVMLYLLLFTALIVGGYDGGYSTWTIAPLALASIALIVVGLLIASLRRPGFRDRMAARLARIPRVGTRVAHRIGLLYESHLESHVRGAFRDRRRMARAAGWSMTNWALDFLALYASLTAFDADIRLEGVAVAFAIACFGTWLPITPSGLGVTEGLMIPALIGFGAPQSAAVLGVLTWRAIAYWLPIPIGAVAYTALHLGRPGTARGAPALQ
ncbi:MAG TPA: lysylphosphatidylglycerol synthase transmembrane domain-containing protein [Mycobacteriales bacterium]|nr:lysylphosphatidylglycerol synthase transmembrane domain-containing protein [Mycobacteriales bacterium]